MNTEANARLIHWRLTSAGEGNWVREVGGGGPLDNPLSVPASLKGTLEPTYRNGEVSPADTWGGMFWQKHSEYRGSEEEASVVCSGDVRKTGAEWGEARCGLRETHGQQCRATWAKEGAVDFILNLWEVLSKGVFLMTRGFRRIWVVYAEWIARGKACERIGGDGKWKGHCFLMP